MRRRPSTRRDSRRPCGSPPAPRRRGRPSEGRREPRHGQRPRRGEAGDWHVEADRFTRLTTLLTYLLRVVPRGETRATSTPPAWRPISSSTVDDLKADVRLLNLVNFGGDGALVYAEFERGRAARHLRPRGACVRQPRAPLAAAGRHLLLAVELVGGQLPVKHGAALRAAAAKLAAARSATSPALGAADPLPLEEGVLDAVNDAIRRRRLLEIEYWSEGTGRSTRRVVEPYLLVRSRGEWYYVSYCRTSAGTAHVPRGHDEERPRARGALHAARRHGARPLPPRGHPGQRTVRLAHGGRLVRRPCGAGSRNASRSRRCPTALAWPPSPTSASTGSWHTCCPSAARRCRSRRRPRRPRCARPSRPSSRATNIQGARRERPCRGSDLAHRLCRAARALPVPRLPRGQEGRSARSSTGSSSAFSPPSHPSSAPSS